MARFTCERKGMQLASIHSRTEADYVYKLVLKKKPRYGDSNVWLGMLKGVTCKSGKWVALLFSRLSKNEDRNGKEV